MGIIDFNINVGADNKKPLNRVVVFIFKATVFFIEIVLLALRYLPEKYANILYINVLREKYDVILCVLIIVFSIFSVWLIIGILLPLFKWMKRKANSRKVVSYLKNDKLSTIHLGFLFEAIRKNNRSMNKNKHRSMTEHYIERYREINSGKRYINKYDCSEYRELIDLNIIIESGFYDVIHEAAWKYMKKNYRQVFRRFLNNKD